MASQTKPKPAAAKAPSDHKRTTEEIRAESVERNPNLDLLINPARASNPNRIRFMALAGVMQRELGIDPDAEGEQDIDVDPSDPALLNAIADVGDFMNERFAVDAAAVDKLNALELGDYINLVLELMSTVGESVGSSK